MPALARLPQRDRRADVASLRQAGGGHKRIVQCIHGQRRHLNTPHVRFGRGALPVILCVLETMQRRGHNIVEGVQVPRGQKGFGIEQTRMLLKFFHGLGHHGIEKHAGVNQPVKAAAYGMAAGCQIERGANRCDSCHHTAGLAAHLSGPAHQGIAAE